MGRWVTGGFPACIADPGAAMATDDSLGCSSTRLLASEDLGISIKDGCLIISDLNLYCRDYLSDQEAQNLSLAPGIISSSLEETGVLVLVSFCDAQPGCYLAPRNAQSFTIMTRRSDKTNYGLVQVATRREPRFLWVAKHTSLYLETQACVCTTLESDLLSFQAELCRLCLDFDVHAERYQRSGGGEQPPISSAQWPPAGVPQNRRDQACRPALSRFFRKYLSIDRWTETM